MNWSIIFHWYSLVGATSPLLRSYPPTHERVYSPTHHCHHRCLTHYTPSLFRLIGWQINFSSCFHLTNHYHYWCCNNYRHIYCLTVMQRVSSGPVHTPILANTCLYIVRLSTRSESVVPPVWLPIAMSLSAFLPTKLLVSFPERIYSY